VIPTAPPGSADSHFSLTDDMLAELRARLHLRSGGDNDARSQGNDIELNYKLEGDGEDTIVLVNGLADDLPDLGAPDGRLPGRGLPRPAVRQPGDRGELQAGRPYTSRMLADDAKALADSLGITDFHLMGVSMGGMIAQEYALAYPADLRSLPSPARMRRPGLSAPGCSRCGPTWPRCSASRSSCGTSRSGHSRAVLRATDR
jgi:pimeloyl-ACP methyl ester carboxylesterase